MSCVCRPNLNWGFKKRCLKAGREAAGSQGGWRLGVASVAAVRPALLSRFLSTPSILNRALSARAVKRAVSTLRPPQPRSPCPAADWAIKVGVDFLAISFVRSADALHNLRSYITQVALNPKP
jgi:hypothetical protein